MKDLTVQEQLLYDFCKTKTRDFIDYSLLQDVKDWFDIDFRKDVYIDNQYNLSPIFDYERAKEIILYANSLLVEKYGSIRSWNLYADIEYLRKHTLESYLKRLFDLYSDYKMLDNKVKKDSKFNNKRLRDEIIFWSP